MYNVWQTAETQGTTGNGEETAGSVPRAAARSLPVVLGIPVKHVEGGFNLRCSIPNWIKLANFANVC